MGRTKWPVASGQWPAETCVSKSPNLQIPKSPNPQIPPRRLAAIAIFLLAAAAGCGPWFAKNWVLTGNPTYPLLYQAFDGKTWNADKEQQVEPRPSSARLLRHDAGQQILAAYVSRASGLVRWSCHWRRWRSSRPRRCADADSFGGCFSTRASWSPCGGFLRIASTGSGYPCCPCWRCWPARGHVGRSARWWQTASQGAYCWRAWRRTSWWPPAGEGNEWFVPLDDLRNDPQRMISPWHWYFNLEPEKGGVLLVGDAAVFDLKPPIWYNTCFDDCIFERLVKGKTAAADSGRACRRAHRLCFCRLERDCPVPSHLRLYRFRPAAGLCAVGRRGDTGAAASAAGRTATGL